MMRCAYLVTGLSWESGLLTATLVQALAGAFDALRANFWPGMSFAVWLISLIHLSDGVLSTGSEEMTDDEAIRAAEQCREQLVGALDKLVSCVDHFDCR